MEKVITESEKIIADAPKEIREAHSQRVSEIRNKDYYKSRMAIADTKETIACFINDVLSDSATKKDSAMVAAIAELAKTIS